MYTAVGTIQIPLIYVQHAAAQSGRDELNMYSSVHSWFLIVKLINIIRGLEL